MTREPQGAESGVEISNEPNLFGKVRPRDAATLVLVDRSDGGLRVLVGKRSTRHVFMPDTYVFPGGRRDRTDHALPYATDLHPQVMGKLLTEAGANATARKVRALALAAVRELQEETGLVIGDDLSGRHLARLDSLRYIARAITPPGSVRRFDTRFFCTFADEAGINPALIRDTAELHDLRWLDVTRDDTLTMPRITRTVLEDLKNLIDNDPALPFGTAVPYYFSRRGQAVRSSI